MKSSIFAGMEFSRRDVAFQSEGTACAGWYYVPAKTPTAAIVMAHGWSSVKEMFLDNFAAAFAKAGFVVLAFDYRGFGGSEGSPRQRVIPSEQQQDYRNAITFLCQQPEVDSNRIGLWGSSYSGAHVLQVAAEDRRVKAVVSQIPAVNASKIALHWILLGWWREVWQNTLFLLRQMLCPWKTLYIPVVNTHGLPATLPGEESHRWMLHAAKQAPAWKNEVSVSSAWKALTYNASRYIEMISPTPLLMVVADHDDIALTSEGLKAFEMAREPKKLLQVAGGHFDVYEEPGLSQVLPAQVDWFRKHLSPIKISRQEE